MSDPRTLPTRPRTHTAARVLILASMTAAMTVSAGAIRADAGSDSPTPYTVDRTGITLPAGETTFPDNGHVNIRWNGGHAGLHFESKCITRTDAECAGSRHDAAQYIGASFIPWTAFGVPADACIEWVQIAQYPEHYGEGGQAPICLNEEEPCPTETTPSSPEPTSPEPSPTPTPTSDPTPTPSESGPSSEPGTPQPEPSSEPTSPSPRPSDPEPSDSPTSPVTSPTPANTDPTTTSNGRDASTTAAENYGEGDDEASAVMVSTDDEVPAALNHTALAATGVEPWFALGGAVILVLLGLIAVGARRGGRR